VFEAFAEKGAAGAREVLTLHQEMTLCRRSRGRPPARNREGDGAARRRRRRFARSAIAAAEQIKAATGVDLAAAAHRLEGSPKPR
jgi:hypothetical protein